MADEWEKVYIPVGMSQFSFQDTITPDSKDSGLRYVWAGNISKKAEVGVKGSIVPYCSKCVELIRDLNDCSPKCPHCLREFWNGPFCGIVGQKDSEIKPCLVSAMEGMSLSSGTTANLKAFPPVAPAEMPTEPPSSRFYTVCQLPTSPSPLSATSQLFVPCEVPSGGEASAMSLAKKRAIKHRRGRRCSSSKSSQTSLPSSLRSRATKDSKVSTPEPALKWQDYDTLSTKNPPSKISIYQEKTLALPRCTSMEDKVFWVLPGRANRKIFRKVSRVQRIINFRVHELWGFYMPYAPEWVYDVVEKHLEEWIYGEVCRKEAVGPQGLFHPNPKKRERDLTFLCDVVGEWWFGRTILKHYVKSCGKYSKEKHFSISVLLPNGGRIDKPHPKYYISYEDIVAKCGVKK